MYKSYVQNLYTEELQSCIKQAFETEADWQKAKLQQADIDEILKEDPEICDDSVRESIVGYPTRPLWKELSSVICTWMNTGHCPVLDLPNYDLLDERTYTEKRAEIIGTITPLLKDIQTNWKTTPFADKVLLLQNIIMILGKRGLLDLLGLRNTAGTYQLWPPPRRTIEDIFNAPNKPNTAAKLTVGARALSKHCHRDQTLSWWGDCTGKEHEKNAHADELLKKVLNNARWINIHSLPHHVIVIETREEHGYGLRWSADGKQFRGFLEPQMVDGHDVGWKH